jgi:membrane-bound ClpP family serine protease
MEPLAWSICLLIAAIALVALELFIPSGGLLGFLSAVAVVASVIVAFTAGPRTGLLMLVVTLVVVPAVLASAVKWWPHTPIGRLILIALPEAPDDVLPDTEQYRGLKTLIGKVGKSKSKMMPSGAIMIEGRIYDAVSEGMAIDADATVKVIAVRTNRIVVRQTNEAVTSKVAPPTENAADVLSRPIDSLGIEGFDEPLT